MKLLSWVQRKSQRDTSSSVKGSTVGSSCNVLFLKPSPIEQGDHATPTNNCKVKKQPEQEWHHLSNFNTNNYEEFDGGNSNEIFPGFLTIGTLSMERIEESATPTFDLTHQETHEDGIPEIKYDLELINEKFENFLKAEAEEEEKTASPIRNSQERLLDLRNEVKTEANNHNYVEMQLYPVQGYLLGSSTEHQANKEAKKGKKPLHKLIQKSTSSLTDEKGPQKIAMTETRSPNYLMNKILQTPPTRPQISYGSPGCASEPFVMPTKTNKVKRLFQKKIHPEISRTAEEARKFSRYENQKILKSDSKLCSQSNRIGCWGGFMNMKKYSYRKDIKLPQDTITENLNLPTKQMTGDTGREHWIKTDAEYYVLEL